LDNIILCGRNDNNIRNGRAQVGPSCRQGIESVRPWQIDLGVGREVERKLREVYAATTGIPASCNRRASSDERRKAQPKLEHGNRNWQELEDGDVITVNIGIWGR
jgi:hypothetical protein